ncbi:MAG: hypothetical protein CL942_14145 [Desulfovibrio sp.]|nr:hypothetical protein [Desulfovibrio sp.]
MSELFFSDDSIIEQDILWFDDGKEKGKGVSITIEADPHHAVEVILTEDELKAALKALEAH